MKKKFMEPAMHKIELNLRENIAASGDGEQTTTTGGITFLVLEETCWVVNTEKYAGELGLLEVLGSACYNSRVKIAGKTVPLEEARKYFRG